MRLNHFDAQELFGHISAIFLVGMLGCGLVFMLGWGQNDSDLYIACGMAGLTFLSIFVMSITCMKIAELKTEFSTVTRSYNASPIFVQNAIKDVLGKKGFDKFFYPNEQFFFDNLTRTYVQLEGYIARKKFLGDSVSIEPNLINEEVSYSFTSPTATIEELEEIANLVSDRIIQMESSLYSAIKEKEYIVKTV